MLKKLNQAVDSTQQNTKLIFNIALNYGARTEILDAVKEILEEYKNGKIPLNPDHSNGVSNGRMGGVNGFPELTEDYFSARLYTRGLPDPDLLIRTSGEMRLSNFLLWQLSYAEIYITKKYWPDFKKEDYVKAVREFQKRERRFGDVQAQKERIG